jgi:hypothetical protein
MHSSGFYKTSFWLLLFMFSIVEINAQENPPIPVSVEVNTSQFLNFGSFTGGVNGGTVTVNYAGNRTKTGDIFLLGASESPALFDIIANPGTIMQITVPGQIELTGSNGGQIYLTINSFSTGQTFVTSANPPNTTPVYVGGTLSIGDQTSAIPGNYNGNFTLTFIHQ